MADIVVTVPKGLWAEWLDEGDPPGSAWSEYDSHFYMRGLRPAITPGERVYIVAHGKLRGYAPLVMVESRCQLVPGAWCLLRRDGAVAMTIPEPIRGFQGWRYRHWDSEQEIEFPDWRTP